MKLHFLSAIISVAIYSVYYFFLLLVADIDTEALLLSSNSIFSKQKPHTNAVLALNQRCELNKSTAQKRKKNNKRKRKTKLVVG